MGPKVSINQAIQYFSEFAWRIMNASFTRKRQCGQLYNFAEILSHYCPIILSRPRWSSFFGHNTIERDIRHVFLRAYIPASKAICDRTLRQSKNLAYNYISINCKLSEGPEAQSVILIQLKREPKCRGIKHQNHDSIFHRSII